MIGPTVTIGRCQNYQDEEGEREISIVISPLRFVCAFMATGLEFDGVVQFVKKTCDDLGVKLIISTPAHYKGNLFKRIDQFRSWPGLIATWCCRDLIAPFTI